MIQHDTHQIHKPYDKIVIMIMPRYAIYVAAVSRMGKEQLRHLVLHEGGFRRPIECAPESLCYPLPALSKAIWP